MAPLDIDGVKSLGTAVLAADGSVIKSSGDLSNDPQTVTTLYQMILDTGSILKDEPLRRVTVSYSSHQYVIAVAQNCVYIVKSVSEGV